MFIGLNKSQMNTPMEMTSFQKPSPDRSLPVMLRLLSWTPQDNAVLQNPVVPEKALQKHLLGHPPGCSGPRLYAWELMDTRIHANTNAPS